jgi:hypothetical protein
MKRALVTIAITATLASSAFAFQPTPGAYRDQLKSLEAQLFDIWWHQLAPSDRAELLSDERAFEHRYDKQTDGATKLKAITDRLTFLRGITRQQAAAVEKASPGEQSTPAPQVSASDLQPAAGLGTCVIHKGSLIADTLEDRKLALQLFGQKDEASFMEMVHDGNVIILKADTRAYIDDITWNQIVKVHFKGNADSPYYADGSDVTIDKPQSN